MKPRDPDAVEGLIVLACALVALYLLHLLVLALHPGVAP